MFESPKDGVSIQFVSDESSMLNRVLAVAQIITRSSSLTDV